MTVEAYQEPSKAKFSPRALPGAIVGMAIGFGLHENDRLAPYMDGVNMSNLAAITTGIAGYKLTRMFSRLQGKELSTEKGQNAIALAAMMGGLAATAYNAYTSIKYGTGVEGNADAYSSAAVSTLGTVLLSGAGMAAIVEAHTPTPADTSVAPVHER